MFPSSVLHQDVTKIDGDNMQKPISIQIPLLNHNSPLGEPPGTIHGEPPGTHGEPPHNLAQMHGTEVVDNTQKIPGIIPKAFSNHHPVILTIFCHPSGPRQANLSKIGHRYQSSEKLRMNTEKVWMSTVTTTTNPMLMLMLILVNGRVLEAAHWQLPLLHQPWVPPHQHLP